MPEHSTHLPVVHSLSLIEWNSFTCHEHTRNDDYTATTTLKKVVMMMMNNNKKLKCGSPINIFVTATHLNRHIQWTSNDVTFGLLFVDSILDFYERNGRRRRRMLRMNGWLASVNMYVGPTDDNHMYLCCK